MLILNSPELFEDVLKLQFDNFPKGVYQCENMRDLLGSGIFAVDGMHWKQQRKSASRVFTAQALRECMSSIVHRHLEVLTLELGEVADNTNDGIDLQALLSRFTFDVFAEIGFGIKPRINPGTNSLAGLFQQAFDSAQRVIARRFIRPVWFWKLQRWLNVGLEGQLRRDLVKINTISEIMTSRLLEQREGTNQVTIASLFLDSATLCSGASSQKSNRLELRDAVVNFMLAGRDTTAQALSWLMYCLARHPKVEDRIRKELQDTAASGNQTDHEDSAGGGHIYLEAAIRETLRLYLPVPFTTKDAIADTVLSDGTPVCAGTTIGLAFFAMGRNRNVWGDDAEEFKPERWLDGSSDPPKLKNVSAFRFTAFNAGPRTCLGMNLAMLEMEAVTAALLRSFRFELPSKSSNRYVCEPDLGLTMPIRGGLPVRVFRL